MRRVNREVARRPSLDPPNASLASNNRRDKGEIYAQPLKAFHARIPAEEIATGNVDAATGSESKRGAGEGVPSMNVTLEVKVRPKTSHTVIEATRNCGRATNRGKEAIAKLRVDEQEADKAPTSGTSWPSTAKFQWAKAQAA
jgi:hypothetical protein